MEIYHTSLGEEMGPRNGPEENYSPMMTEKLGTIQLTDGKLASEIARIEKEKNSRIRKKGFLSEDDLSDPLLEVPHLDIIGAYLSIQLKPLSREQKRILLELKTKKPKKSGGGGGGGGGGLSFTVKDPSLSPNALLQALIIDILVIAKPINQSTNWLMVGTLELSEEKKTKKISRKSDFNKKNESKQNHHHHPSSSSCYSELHNTLQISSIYTKRQIFLDRSLKLGKIASHEFHQKILVVVTHGGVRVYDVMALIENRKRLLAKHLPVVPEHESEEEEEEEEDGYSASDSSSTGKGKEKEKESGEIDDNVNGNHLEDQSSHLNNIAKDDDEDEDDEADLPVCLGSLGGVNFEDKISNSFGRINWEGSSISIGKSSNRNGVKESGSYQIPDVYVSRAFPPCLIQIIIKS